MDVICLDRCTEAAPKVSVRPTKCTKLNANNDTDMMVL